MRCVHDHKLDPTRMQDAIILPNNRIREHKDQLEDFLHIARHGMQALYHQVAGLGYAILLTDSHGVTVDFMGDIQLDPSLRKAGLYLGSNWNERFVGTNGVGTCLSTGEALTVHLDDHFDATHIPLTCTAAPVYDAAGHIKAVLDISALTAPADKNSQHLALQLVKMYAHKIENAYFLHHYRDQWILRMSAAPEFLEVSPEYLLAVDSSGKVVGYNHLARQLFKQQTDAELMGLSISELIELNFDDLPRYLSARPVDRRAIKIHNSRQLLFLSVMWPAREGMVGTQQTTGTDIPAELKALTQGDAQLEKQIRRAARLVNSPISILITGETGSGKEYFAKALHQSSERREGPFIAVNCAAIPDSLIESELFGYAPGSFSGAATKGRKGLIQEADGGTLFLDEIGDMPKSLQTRLLRVLSEKEVVPVGAQRPVQVNVRVIAATHCNLESRVREGLFRDDLFYRLNGAHFVLPPVRERQDLGWLIDRAIAKQSAKSAHLHPLSIDAESKALLMRHRWPGNLRELTNVIDFSAAVCADQLITVGDLPEYLVNPDLNDPDSPLIARDLSRHGKQARELLNVLESCEWNVTAAAQNLGIARMTLYRRMKQHGVTPPR
ncbi:MAG: sigma-54-dependent Fis family transcriptional regulator [Burkholderiaceae bacterium]